MKRRAFIAGLASAAAWPPAARAQSASRRYRIGMLDTSARQFNANFGAFQQALREHGYVEGQNLSFEYPSPDGRNESFAELPAELPPPDAHLIFTPGPPPPPPPTPPTAPTP